MKFARLRIRHGRPSGREDRRRVFWRLFYLAALALAAVLFTNSLGRAQQSPASASATATARILRPAVIGLDRALSFGLLRGGYKKGAISIDFWGRRSVSGGAIALYGAPYPASGSYAVTGEAGAVFTVLAPPSIDASGPAGAPALTASNFAVYSVNLRRAGAGGRFDSSGRDRLLLSARLSVPAGAAAGAYRAEVPLVISYQ